MLWHILIGCHLPRASAKILSNPLIPLSSQIDNIKFDIVPSISIKNETQKLSEFATGVIVYLTLFFCSGGIYRLLAVY